MAKLQSQPNLQPKKELSSHNFYSREFYSGLDAGDIQWALDNYRPHLARYGYDVLYEAWLEAIADRESDDAQVTSRLLRVMAATWELGNWAEDWRS